MDHDAEATVADARPAAPSGGGPIPFSEALRFWAKLGFISFGGPAGQIAIMHREIVDRRRWIDEERFLHALNFCMLLPGPEAQQLATYIGWSLHGARGGVAAGVLFVLPSVFLLLALSYVYSAYGNTALVTGMLTGFKPVVVAIVVEACVRIGKRALKGRVQVGIAIVAFLAIFFFSLPFPLIVAAAALAGLLFARGSGEAPEARLEARKGTGQRRAVRIVVVCTLLWAAPFVLLIWLAGPDGLHAKLYLFFTKAAFVTFGGAYAVLAYVTQAVVADFGWLTHAETVDGLALAETTPGPLIMVLQFVGFKAGWNHPGNLPQTPSAVLAALATTWATFLPCFLFIFLGAPYIERLRGNRAIAAGLTGVTAAVVGVVLNLACVFGAAVYFPHGLGGGLNWVALAASVIALVALERFRVDVLWVILASGVAGMALEFFRLRY